ncbi:uncharacterized protein BBOV_IV002580 [Babesia bovis T2Bo]|uniref:Uncharacterized protein n=1 Tax=Babesia bovis TaxID=5865 RepID=A7AVM9_BABBO|nr:uncharacterized protein BBOV_IV002580 [Babesia bovis T2Bo]EDO05855.1 hypothetical protein BBOV_IV002580 [Babesia bovis T2Bo]|eukprot:XP_001609423.1 hypothetical protein [Babesia bovis T2Bo]
MATPRDFADFKDAVALVAEHLPDGFTCCAGLLPPQVSRRIVRDFNDDGQSSVFEGTPSALLIEFPFRKLLLESRVVQRICYGMDDCNRPLFAKSSSPKNNLLLLDPARLTIYLKDRLDSTKRKLLMKCFTADIWLGFLKMLSLGIGERIRMVYAMSEDPIMDDELLCSLEDLQLELVSITSRFTNCNSPGYTLEDIETIILDGCSAALSTSQHINNKWDNMPEIGRTISDLIVFLQNSIAKINALIAPGTHDANQEGGHSPVSPGNIDVGQLRECCTNIVRYLSKAASDLSIAKIKILERRDELFQRSDIFGAISQAVFKRGIHTTEFSVEEVVPMIVMSHCIGAYGIREWCIRYVVEKQVIAANVYEDELASRDDKHLSMLKPSAFFRTAGAVSPETKDFITILPIDLLQYMSNLSNKAV